MSGKKKYYAVRVGFAPGIYETWDACRQMVQGFSGAQYKSFPTREEAQEYLSANEGSSGHAQGRSKVAGRGQTGGVARAEQCEAGQPDSGHPEVYAFVDGSYNEAAGVYGYGGFLVDHGERVTLQGSGAEPEMAGMRNVAGEILGCEAAVREAIARGQREVVIYYDYAGIEMWATGAWKRNKPGTIRYYEYMQSVRDEIRVIFHKVKGHSGVEGNEEADRLARQAAGVS